MSAKTAPQLAEQEPTILSPDIGEELSGFRAPLALATESGAHPDIPVGYISIQ
ncbi:MAG: hypothetical protein QM805_23635 [Pseudomonas sp.]